jgi:SAM-dependent methyltransferase
MSRKRPCPICGVIQSRCLFRQKFQTMAGVGLLQGYDVVICDGCGFAFADDIPPQGVFDDYYRDQSKYEYAHQGGKESALDELRFRDIVATVAPYVPDRAARILEIGCATGRMLALLREAGYLDVAGLDPSPGCAKAAWELYGVPVNVGTVFTIPEPEAPYDFLVMVAVIEHIEDLRGALTHIDRVLAPGGRVFAEVPDAAHLYGLSNSPYQEFSIEHINFFSASSLANLFKSSGFDVLMTGEVVRQPQENTEYPSAFGVFQKGVVSPIVRDERTEAGLTRYIAESAEGEAAVFGRLREVANRGSVVVWGTGTLTQHLLARGAFDCLDIAAFVDSNPKYQGHNLNGKPVLSPASLAGRREPIVISTRGFQAEIQRQIRQHLHLDNEIIVLYPGP